MVATLDSMAVKIKCYIVFGDQKWSKCYLHCTNAQAYNIRGIRKLLEHLYILEIMLNIIVILPPNLLCFVMESENLSPAFQNWIAGRKFVVYYSIIFWHIIGKVYFFTSKHDNCKKGFLRPPRLECRPTKVTSSLTHLLLLSCPVVENEINLQKGLTIKTNPV